MVDALELAVDLSKGGSQGFGRGAGREDETRARDPGGPRAGSPSWRCRKNWTNGSAGRDRCRPRSSGCAGSWSSCSAARRAQTNERRPRR